MTVELGIKALNARRQVAPLAEFWVPLSLLFGLWAATTWILVESLSRNDGHLVYALDDPYIHMAVAKNLVLHGVWGVTPDGFTSSTSSIIWPLLIATVYIVFGVNDWAPLVLNIVAASILVVAANRILMRYGLRPPLRLIFLTALLAAAPIPLLVFTGMEHTLQVLVVIVYADILTRRVAGERNSRFDWKFFLLAPLVTSVRYEDISLICVAVAAELLRRRWQSALVTLGLGVTPIVLFGAISLHSGALFLPNSVLIKAHQANTTPANLTSLGALGHIFASLSQSPLLFYIFLVAALMSVVRLGSRLSSRVDIFDSRLALLGTFGALTIAHAQFALIGNFLRYEAYLIELGLLAIAVSLPPIRRRLPLLYISILVFTPVLLVPREVFGFTQASPATHNIYDQQYQMARFIHQYYAGNSIALNDVGLANYTTDIHCLDVFGLATDDVARRRLAGHYTPRTVATLAREDHVTVALVYDTGFSDGWITQGGVPTNWIKVGTWTVQQKVTVKDRTVSFYATDPIQAEELAAHLRQFDPSLPSDVLTYLD